MENTVRVRAGRRQKDQKILYQVQSYHKRNDQQLGDLGVLLCVMDRVRGGEENGDGVGTGTRRECG